MAVEIKHEMRHNLRVLEQNWDGYQAPPPGETVIKAVESLNLVPMNNGGVQAEWHVQGHCVEVEFDQFGEIVAVMWYRE